MIIIVSFSALLLGGAMIYFKLYKILIVILSFFLIGNGFYFIGERSFDNKIYSDSVAVVGRVTDDVYYSDYYCQVVLDKVVINGEESKNIRLNITNYSKNGVKAGDILAFEGNLERVKPFTLKEFNSSDYRDNVGYNCSVHFKNLVVSSGYVKFDESVRLKVKDLIYKNMSSENAGIAYAVLFGNKNDISGDVYWAYQKSGIIHVLTVSGLHVGFLVSLFYGLLKKCGVNRKVNFIISSVVVLFYCYLCGFSPAVVRASVMSICFMCSKALFKKYDSLSALGLAGFILCIFKPLTALDIGFLMSFFCVFGILMLNPILTRLLSKFLPEKVASLISLSTSAQLGILPFLCYMGGTINLLSFIINLIVVPIFSVLYPFLFIVSMLGTFLPFLGILLKAVDFLLMIVNKIAIFFSFSNLQILLSPLGFAIIMIFFTILFILSQYFMLTPLKKFSLFTGSFVFLVFSFCCYIFPINNSTSLFYLSSYNQTSVVLTSKSGTKVVIGDSYLLSRFQSEYINDDFDLFLSFDALSDNNISSLSELGFDEFVTCDNLSENMQIANKNSFYKVKDIEFSFISENENTFGLILNLDNQRIFVAKQGNLSYNQYENIFQHYQPNLVVTEDNQNLPNMEYVSLSYSDYQTYGNMQLKFNGKDWLKRGIDWKH